MQFVGRRSEYWDTARRRENKRAHPAYPQQSSLQFGTRRAKSTRLVTLNSFLTFYFTSIEHFFHLEANLLLRF